MRKTKNASIKVDDENGEFIDIRLSDELGEEEFTAGTSEKGKEKAIESNEEDSTKDRTGRNFRARKRYGFTEDSSFLAPSPPRRVFPRTASTSEVDSSSSSSSSSDSDSEEIKIKLPDPSPELLKCIHHFASRYYQEKGVLSDRSKGYRDERKTRRSKSSVSNIHDQATSKPALWTRDSSLDADDDDQWEDEKDELGDKEGEWEDDEMEDGENASRNEEHKDMYKALDGSALVAIGIILQEQLAHAMIAGFSGTHAHRMRRRNYSTERSSSSPSPDSD